MIRGLARLDDPIRVVRLREQWKIASAALEEARTAVESTAAQLTRAAQAIQARKPLIATFPDSRMAYPLPTTAILPLSK